MGLHSRSIKRLVFRLVIGVAFQSGFVLTLNCLRLPTLMTIQYPDDAVMAV